MSERTILYVDDDQANLTVLEAVCGGEFEVLTALNGADALEILESREIAILLVDQRMPGMSGVEVLERARLTQPSTVRMIVTAYSDLTDAINAINRGQVHRYVRKPWNAQELRMILRQALAMRETDRKVTELEHRLVETERVYALGVIAAGVAHELRNPLTNLVGMLDLARDQLTALPATFRADPHLAKVETFVKEAQQSTEELMEITRGIELGFRRQDDVRSTDLVEVISLTLKTVRGTLLRKASIQLELPERMMVPGSPTQLGQVSLNLMVNALQALPDDGPKKNMVRVRVREDGRQAEWTVEDNGPGIGQDVVDRIFQPFFTTKTSGGTGLGLAITRSIVEDLGGRIAVEAIPEGGARFTVRLPRADEAQP